MRYRTWDQWRDLTVRVLARISLVVVLAVLGAMFVGSAAASQGAPAQAPGSTVSAKEERIRPVGIVLGAAMIGGGLVVLMIGAFRPPTRSERRDSGDTLRH